jgi:DNA-binding transcriptional ArsR family regulator
MAAPSAGEEGGCKVRLTRVVDLYNTIVMKQIAYTSDRLDAVFGALADPTRRAILRRLAEGEASVTELAAPFRMSQPAVSRHLRVLEDAGLVDRSIDRQRRPARLRPEQMLAAVRWLEEFRRFWSSSFDQLDGLIATMKRAEAKGRKK